VTDRVPRPNLDLPGNVPGSWLEEYTLQCEADMRRLEHENAELRAKLADNERRWPK